MCDQIVAESHGNPLALLELPRTWHASELAGGFGLPGGPARAGKIERSYIQRLLQLPAETQLLILTAAAKPFMASYRDGSLVAPAGAAGLH